MKNLLTPTIFLFVSNSKILKLQRKKKKKMKSHINCAPKAITKLIISHELKTNTLDKFVRNCDFKKCD
jgi:hypothetical protein